MIFNMSKIMTSEKSTPLDFTSKYLSRKFYMRQKQTDVMIFNMKKIMTLLHGVVVCDYVWKTYCAMQTFYWMRRVLTKVRIQSNILERKASSGRWCIVFYSRYKQFTHCIALLNWEIWLTMKKLNADNPLSQLIPHISLNTPWSVARICAWKIVLEPFPWKSSKIYFHWISGFMSSYAKNRGSTTYCHSLPELMTKYFSRGIIQRCKFH